MSEENLDILINIVLMQKTQKNYANARTLRECLSRVEIKQAGRIRRENLPVTDHELTEVDLLATFGKAAVEYAKNLAEAELDAPSCEMCRIDNVKAEHEKVFGKSYEESEQRVRESVVALKTDTGESSGFIITSDGYIVTCAHCVNGAKKIDVRHRIMHRGRRMDIHYDATIVAIDVPNDVAIIKMNTNETFDYIAMAPEGVEDLAPLSKIHVLGYPFGVSRFDEMSINEGKIASYQRNRANGEADQINLDVSAKSGNSGSCVIDIESGLVIGILCGSSISQSGNLVEEINYCRPISYIWDLIRKYQ